MHQINYNGGRVHLLMFVAKMQPLLGLTEQKVVEYLKLLETVGDIKRVEEGHVSYIETTDKTRVRVIKLVEEKPKIVKDEKMEEEASVFLDKFL